MIFRGNESHLLQLALDGSIQLVIADAVLDEARAVLQSKFSAHVSVIETFIKLLDYERVPLPTKKDIETAAKLLRDPADAVILASIINARPDVALTGDKDLLTDEVRDIAPVSKCADYLHRLLSE